MAGIKGFKAARIYRKFRHTHHFFRSLLVDRVMIEKDNVVLITGKRGTGKSTLTLKMALGFNNLDEIKDRYMQEFETNWGENEINDLPYDEFNAFDMNTHMVFTQEELEEYCKNLRRGFIMADEAVVNASRRNSMTRANKILHQIITINRKNFNTLLFCLPSVEDFDISILQYVSHWVHIDDRGLAAVMLPNPPSIFGRKSWDIDKMKKIYDKFQEENPSAGAMPYWLFDNFRGYIAFSKLSSGVEKQYLEISHRKKNEGVEAEKRKMEEKENKKQMDPVKKNVMDTIAERLKDNKIKDFNELVVEAQDLQMTRDQLQRFINNNLSKYGEGRTLSQIFAEHKRKEKLKKEKVTGRAMKYTSSNRFSLLEDEE